MAANQSNIKRMEKWHVQTPEEPGFHTIFSPEKSECTATRIYRLNLRQGEAYTLESGALELFAALIIGEAALRGAGMDRSMKRLDAFFIPGGNTVELTAAQDCSFYIGGAECAGIGKPCFLPYDPSIPLGPKHEIHESGTAQREVFLMLDEATPASRLMCGYTFGGDGGWTSWPPHEHQDTLEETYCYFDMPFPRFGFQLTYLEEGGTADVAAHTVTGGSMVNFPAGYHPTVTTPGSRNIYLWVLAAFKPEYRKFGVMNFDKHYKNTLK